MGDAFGQSLLEPLIRWLKERSGVQAAPFGFAWATVDVDRTIRDLGLTEQDPAWEETTEALLGGAGWRITFGTGVGVVLEPSTEGLLAGWLARNGEGMVAVYVEAGPGVGPGEPQAMTATGKIGWLERPDTPFGMFVIRLAP